jgi:hypothetical protein
MKAKMIRRVYTFGFRKTRDRVVASRFLEGDKVKDVEQVVAEEYVEEAGKEVRVVVLGGDANHYAVWHVQDFTEEIEVPEGGADVRVPDGGDRGGRSAADGGRGTSKRRRTGNQKS